MQKTNCGHNNKIFVHEVEDIKMETFVSAFWNLAYLILFIALIIYVNQNQKLYSFVKGIVNDKESAATAALATDRGGAFAGPGVARRARARAE